MVTTKRYYEEETAWSDLQETMSFEEKTFCCSVTVAVVVMCSLEMTAIIISYLTNLEHPLMRCQSYNVSMPGEHSSQTAQRRLCTTSGPLLAWLIAHLFINLVALVAIQTSRYRALIPYICTAVIDLLVSSAYLVVLFVQMIRGDQIENVMMFFLNFSLLLLSRQNSWIFSFQILVLFIAVVVVFKCYSVYCSRRLYWILQSVFDRRYTTRTMVVKDDSVFQF
ncbi:hypothetical protein Y032_0085g1882 [Ancylostoma ceylanicum]|uniref:Uncharacterized protein n=1 Tax=Ancylostoma ceylanicum TaxID=53326 RepID=A0A016TQM6_9BILA|nr:hypothetical protein Y032_0085g1882 [Ancylostoma ceylanicum]